MITEDQLKTFVVNAKLIDEKGLAEVIQYAKETNIGFSEALIEKGVTTDENLGSMIAILSKVPYVILSKMSIPDDVLHIVPERIARKYKLIAFGRGADGIKVATTNPTNVLIFSMLTRKTGQKVIPYYATERDIQGSLHIYRKDFQKTIDGLLSDSANNVYDELPIAKIVDVLIETAYQEHVSDIHIEPQEKEAIVRFRIDGILHDVLKMSRQLHDRIMTRIKVSSNLRTDEHLSAQDGKMRLKLEYENLDIRVSILPIADGEKAVLRLLSSKSKQYTLSDLGMNDRDLAKVMTAASKSFGMILSTGPTGSGKTTSIYSMLKIINTREKNITTVEDPVEYRIKGANQVQVNTKTNLTFANGLRSILRQDPNVIFVGEIRDNETAGIAVNASLTGHLVFSTLHTNDAATAIPRLTDMKVEPFLVASTVSVIIAQRLLRKNCDMCKRSAPLSWENLSKNIPEEVLLRNLGGKKEMMVYKGKGCKICHFTGYSGRVGAFEVLEVTPAIRALVTEKVDADVIVKAAIKEGMTLMIDDGLQKVIRGVTTIEEVLRVTKAESA